MADLTRVPVASLTSILPGANQKISGLKAGEALVAGDLAYIKSDGLVWKANGTAVNAAARVRGVVMNDAPVGEACTIAWDITIRYAAGLTPGADYFLSTNAGLFSTVATTGGVNPVGYAVDTTRIHILATN
jgi:hypothetical protein